MNDVDLFWKAKTAAFLHDPPHKPLVLGLGHAAIGQKLADMWMGEPLSHAGWTSAIQQADWLASGADRERFLRDVTVDPRRDLTLIHPLDGQPLHTFLAGTQNDGVLRLDGLRLQPDDVHTAQKVTEDVFSSIGAWLAKEKTDPRTRYLTLWRFLPDILRAYERHNGSQRPLAALWERLPADTRMPTHSVLSHCTLTSCLASVLHHEPRGALFLFTVGPVQGFIGHSRRVADLWAGSSLLSDCIWAAMREVCLALGPDHVLFPSLRGQPLLDRWLLEDLGLARWTEAPGVPPMLKEALQSTHMSLKNRLRIPSLPNRFAAIVPRSHVQRVGEFCEKAVRCFWDETFERSLPKLADALGCNDEAKGLILHQAKRQLQALLEVSWCGVPWDLSARGSQLMAGDRTPLGSPWRARDALELTRDLPGYEPNAGVLYGDIMAEAQRVLDGLKRNGVNLTDSAEDGLKCSICGEREVLR